MSQRRILRVVFMLAMSLMTTGCWDAAEIDQLALVVASGVDVGDSPKTLRGYLQIAIPSSLGTSSGGTPTGTTGGTKTFSLVEGTGSDIIEVQQDAMSKISRKVLLSHRRVIVLGEDYARNGIANLVDEVIRNPRSRMRTILVVAYHGQALPLLQSPYPLERLPQEAVVGFVKEKTKMEFSVKDFISNSAYGDPYTIGIEPIGLKGGLTEEGFRISHLAVFQGNKLVGWLKGDDFEGFLWARGTVRTKLSSVEVTGHGKVDTDLLKSKTTKKVQWVRGKPSVLIQTEIKEDIVENASDLNLNQPANIQLVEQAHALQVQQQMKEAVRKLQRDYRADPLGIMDAIYRSNPRWWHQHERNWRSQFEKVPVQVQVQVEIRRTGMASYNV